MITVYAEIMIGNECYLGFGNSREECIKAIQEHIWKATGKLYPMEELEPLAGHSEIWAGMVIVR